MLVIRTRDLKAAWGPGRTRSSVGPSAEPELGLPPGTPGMCHVPSCEYTDFPVPSSKTCKTDARGCTQSERSNKSSHGVPSFACGAFDRALDGRRVEVIVAVGLRRILRGGGKDTSLADDDARLNHSEPQKSGFGHKLVPAESM